MRDSQGTRGDIDRQPESVHREQPGELHHDTVVASPTPRPQRRKLPCSIFNQPGATRFTALLAYLLRPSHGQSGTTQSCVGRTAAFAIFFRLAFEMILQLFLQFIFYALMTNESTQAVDEIVQHITPYAIPRI
jgi:hypothetical protein